MRFPRGSHTTAFQPGSNRSQRASSFQDSHSQTARTLFVVTTATRSPSAEKAGGPLCIPVIPFCLDCPTNLFDLYRYTPKVSSWIAKSRPPSGDTAQLKGYLESSIL